MVIMKYKDTCKIAFIGAGYTAREHIKAFRDVQGADIIGIHSRTYLKAEQLAKEFEIPNVCYSIAELYEKTIADLVVITVNELSMNSVSKACFEYPWVSLLEKPAGYNCEDAEDILASAKARERKVYVALNRRFYSSTRVTLDDLKSINNPRFIKIQDQEDQISALAVGQPKEVVNHWMYANSIHLIDYFRLLGRGGITQVTPIIPWNPQKPDTIVALIKFDKGDIGIYEGIWNAPAPWIVSVTTAKRRWELRPIEQAGFQNYGERKVTSIDQHPWDLTYKPGFRLQAEMAVRASLGKPSEAVTLEDATETMKLIKAIYGLKR